MPAKNEYKEVWKGLADLIDGLPAEERVRYQSNIAMFIHDLRQVIGIIYSAEGILRKTHEDNQEDVEVLDMIRRSTQRGIRLLTDFAQPFDAGITLPIGNPPEDKNPSI
ncbi:MAG: hypothetical protein ACM3PY_06805 [Omnitrophica WOR_2 bacterium]